MKRFKFIYALVAVMFFTACEDDLQLDPVDRLGTNTAITTPGDVVTAVLGIYNNLQGGSQYGNLGITGTGTLSDEGIHSGSFPTISEMDNNNVFASNVTVRGYWDSNYSGLFMANFVLSQLDNVNLSAGARSVAEGEAKFLRALFHFHLVNLYGPVPIAITPEFSVLENLPRSPIADVYAQIDSDLNEAITLLNGVDHGGSSANRVRATSMAAKALLARSALYQGNTALATTMATDVIDNGGFALEADYADVFSGISNEVIFQVFASVGDQNAIAGQYQNAANGGRLEHAASGEIVAIYDLADPRRAFNLVAETAVSSGFAVNKYRDAGNGTDQPVVLRLAEMYLIRAEANLGTAQGDADLNVIRARAGLAPIAGATLNDILDERMRELAFEGHRWFDIKRTGQADRIMSAANPGGWASTDVFMPIHPQELSLNTNLVQTPGY